MVKIDYKDSRSIHQQIEDGIKSLIVNKVLLKDQQLPSVRELSIELTVNPNTVQKAYKQLEASGYIYSIKGKGNFVAPVSCTKDDVKIASLYNELEGAIKSLMYLGEDWEKIVAYAEKIRSEVND